MPLPNWLTDYLAEIVAIVSAVIAFVSYLAAKDAARNTMTWTLRNQLADATSRMVQADMAIRDAEVQMAAPGTTERQGPPLRTKRMISEQLRYASAAQADAIMQELQRLHASHLISVQDNSIAARSFSAYDDPRAEPHWIAAIRGAHGSGFFEAHTRRDYAKFLFTQGEARHEAGRSAYQLALAAAPKTERGVYEQMWVYIELARDEWRSGNENLVQAALDHAQESVNLLTGRKLEAQKRLDEVRQEILGVKSSTI